MKELRIYAMLVGQEVGEIGQQLGDKRIWVIAESEVEACELCVDAGHLMGVWVEYDFPISKRVIK